MIFRVIIVFFFLWSVFVAGQDTVKTKYKLPPFKDLTLVDKEDSALANRKAYFKKNRQYKFPEEMKRHFVYVMPGMMIGDGWLDLGIWIGTRLGYDKLFLRTNKKPFILGIRVGVLAISEPNDKETGGIFWTTIPHTQKSTGFMVNGEHKLFLKKKFYYSTNLLFQNTTTHRVGEYMKNEAKPINNNNYKVNRSVVAVIPKFGFMLVNKYRIFTDVGLGIGVRYIYSVAKNKLNRDANQDIDEYQNVYTLTFGNGYKATQKLFDEGGSFAQRITFQFKLGYNF